jgi:hypothetical protein
LNLQFYRFFLVVDGRLVAPEVLQCDGDSAAIERAKDLLAKSGYAQMEVWEGTRKVGFVTLR